MKAINGGSAVQGGYYLSKSNWEIFPIEKDGQKLPGASSEHYVKLLRLVRDEGAVADHDHLAAGDVGSAGRVRHHPRIARNEFGLHRSESE